MEGLGQPIAEGRTARVYAWKDGRILKLFYEWMPAQAVNYEAKIAAAVHDAGLPAPGQVERIDFNGKHGLLVERVEGPSMGDLIATRPERTAEYARLLAGLHAFIHRQSLDWLPSAAEGLKHAIRSSSDLPERYVAAALSQIEVMPHGTALLHGDFHPFNLIMHQDRPMVLDR
jgi:aminoglycoside phosphotransferase (APT) family kinase protein